jgi:hypothetical protein
VEVFWLNRKVCDFSIVEFHLDIFIHLAVETWPILTQNSPHQRRNLIKLKHKNLFTKEILHTLRNLFSRTTKNKITHPARKILGADAARREAEPTVQLPTPRRALEPATKYPPKYSAEKHITHPARKILGADEEGQAREMKT